MEKTCNYCTKPKIVIEQVDPLVCQIHMQRKCMICIQKNCEQEEKIVCQVCKKLLHNNHKFKLLSNKSHNQISNNLPLQKNSSGSVSQLPSHQLGQQQQLQSKPKPENQYFQQQMKQINHIYKLKLVQQLLTLSPSKVAILQDKCEEVCIWNTKNNKIDYRFKLQTIDGQVKSITVARRLLVIVPTSGKCQYLLDWGKQRILRTISADNVNFKKSQILSSDWNYLEVAIKNACIGQIEMRQHDCLHGITLPTFQYKYSKAIDNIIVSNIPDTNQSMFIGVNSTFNGMLLLNYNFSKQKVELQVPINEIDFIKKLSEFLKYDFKIKVILPLSQNLVFLAFKSGQIVLLSLPDVTVISSFNQYVLIGEQQLHQLISFNKINKNLFVAAHYNLVAFYFLNDQKQIRKLCVVRNPQFSEKNIKENEVIQTFTQISYTQFMAATTLNIYNIF